jgi:hypothetical protein
MTRSLVAALIVAALLAGLVLAPAPGVGQSELPLEGHDTTLINDVVPVVDLEPLEFLKLARPAAEKPVGRYQLAASGQTMLDTANGTLYRLDSDRWRVEATLESAE